MGDRPPATFALISGGGTAGHVLPAIAIGQALVALGHAPGSLHFVGSAGRIEERLVPEAGFALTTLPGRGIQRRLTLENVAALVGIVRALVQAVALVRRLRPRVVIAMGGFASVPCGLAAVLWRVPIVVAEQNAVPGLANRVIARFARASAVSFPATGLPREVVTGNPVRPEVLAVGAGPRDRAAAKAAIGAPSDRSLVLVVGGSLGARRLNLAAVDAIGAWSGRPDLAVRHVVGTRDWDEVTALLSDRPTGELAYEAVRYEERMPEVLAAADVAVCRSGSSTCFEVATVGLPAVLVPSPFVTGDHQSANARHLVEAGVAVAVPDAELTAERLVAEVDALLADPARRAAMSEAGRRFARPGAADEIAALAEHHARPAPEAAR